MKYYFYALLVLIADQVSKWIIKSKLTLGETRSVIGDFFLITSHRNRGAAFSILQGKRWFFLLITVAVVIGIIVYLQRMRREGRTLMCVALCLLLGGAVGNFIDRALHGEVVDFLQFNFRFGFFGKDIDYTYPIFNVADSAIVVGVILILLEALLGGLRKQKRGLEQNEQGQG